MFLLLLDVLNVAICCYTNVMFQYGREKTFCDTFVTESYSKVKHRYSYLCLQTAVNDGTSIITLKLMDISLKGISNK